MPIYRVPIEVRETTSVFVDAPSPSAARVAARDARNWRGESDVSTFHIAVRTKVRIIEVTDGSVVEP